MDSQRGSWFVPFVVAAALASPLGYLGTYAWARTTHRLVNYGGFVARPNAMSGIGYSHWEMIFAPATTAESWARGALSR